MATAEPLNQSETLSTQQRFRFEGPITIHPRHKQAVQSHCLVSWGVVGKPSIPSEVLDETQLLAEGFKLRVQSLGKIVRGWGIGFRVKGKEKRLGIRVSGVQ